MRTTHKLGVLEGGREAAPGRRLLNAVLALAAVGLVSLGVWFVLAVVWILA